MSERCILAGRWKRRRLPVHPQAPCRPTLGMQRERLFNWLQSHIAGARCLDLFAGSGALGLEALSRGAGLVLMFENFAPQAELIRQFWAQECNLGCLQVRCQNVCRVLEQPPLQSFDLVFLDPPFTQNLWGEVEEKLVKNDWVKAGSWLMREIPISYSQRKLGPPWLLVREKAMTRLVLQLYRWV